MAKILWVAFTIGATIGCGSGADAPPGADITADANDGAIDVGALESGPDAAAGADTARDAGRDSATVADGAGADAKDASDAGAEVGPTAPTFWPGVNLSGAEFGSAIPGSAGKDYTFPTHAEIDYFLGKGLKMIRLPFLWERLQASPLAELSADTLTPIQDVVAYVKSKGGRTLLDPHNYARYRGQVIGAAGGPSAADFADLWKRLATLFKDDGSVVFGLMNEPHDLDTKLWLDDANAAIAAIRGAGAKQTIFVPGNNWTGAHSWGSTTDPTSSAAVMLGVVDPADNYVFEVHQYLDGDSSGTSDACVSATIGSERLQAFTTWLVANGKRGFLGEFAGGRNDNCYKALEDMLGFVDKHRDVWVGYTWWAAGAWWGEYMYTLEPAAGADRPQMAVLLKHL